MSTVSIEKSLKRVPKNLKSAAGLAEYVYMLKHFALPLAKKHERVKAKYEKKSAKKTIKRKTRARKDKTPVVIKEIEEVIKAEPVHTLATAEPIVVPTVVVEPVIAAKPKRKGKSRAKLTAAERKKISLANLAKAKAVREAKLAAKKK